MTSDFRPLYRRILDQSWERLASPIRELHSVASESVFVGRCTVVRGRNPFAWLIATLIGFPRAGVDQPIAVTLVVQGDGEHWTRSSGGRSFSSLQRAGRGSSEGLVTERFGPVSVDMALAVQAADLHYTLRRWRLCGVPLPLWLGPRSAACESVQDGNFKFDVEIRHPLAGLIVRYYGVLTPAPRLHGA